jgi:class I fructose-bisphosphate aldolase
MQELEVLLGHKLEQLLSLKTCKVSKDLLSLSGPDFVDRIFAHSDRNIRVLQNLQAIFNHRRLSNTGYLSILPVDQGIEHSAGAFFAPNFLWIKLLK